MVFRNPKFSKIAPAPAPVPVYAEVPGFKKISSIGTNLPGFILGSCPETLRFSKRTINKEGVVTGKFLDISNPEILYKVRIFPKKREMHLSVHIPGDFINIVVLQGSEFDSLTNLSEFETLNKNIEENLDAEIQKKINGRST